MGIFLFAQFTVDDAFICFRYGYNLINYGIWNWNSDYDVVEPYTSFSYMILSVFPPLLNIQPQLYFKFFTFLIFALLSYRIYTNCNNKLNGLLIISFLCINWQTHVLIYAGLETIFLMYIITEMLIQLNKVNINQKILWFLALLLPLTRPEAIIFSFYILIYIVFIKKEKIHLHSLLSFVVIGLIYFSWRLWYFGLLFPLSFYHKSVTGNMGWMGVAFNTYTAWQYILLTIILLFFVSKHSLAKYSLILSLLIYYFLYSSSALLMNYANRFAFQLFMPSILFSVFIILEIYHEKIKLLIPILLIFIGAITYKGLFDKNPIAIFESSTIRINIKAAYEYHSSYFNIGNKLQKIGSSKFRILSGDAGIIPYLSKAKCFDIYGLADKHLSMNKMDSSYFNTVNADLVIIGPVPNVEFRLDSIKNIQQNMIKTLYLTEMSGKYTRIKGSIKYLENNSHFLFFVKNNSVFRQKLENQINEAIIYSREQRFKVKDLLSFKYLMY